MYASSKCRTSHYISVHGRVLFLTSLLILLPMYMYTDKLHSLRLIKYNSQTYKFDDGRGGGHDHLLAKALAMALEVFVTSSTCDQIYNVYIYIIT